MKKVLSVLAFLSLCICVFNQFVSASLGVSPFLLIGVLALLSLAYLWIAPMFGRGGAGDWRYEQRLIRRPGI